MGSKGEKVPEGEVNKRRARGEISGPWGADGEEPEREWEKLETRAPEGTAAAAQQRL